MNRLADAASNEPLEAFKSKDAKSVPVMSGFKDWYHPQTSKAEIPEQEDEKR